MRRFRDIKFRKLKKLQIFRSKKILQKRLVIVKHPSFRETTDERFKENSYRIGLRGCPRSPLFPKTDRASVRNNSSRAGRWRSPSRLARLENVVSSPKTAFHAPPTPNPFSNERTSRRPFQVLLSKAALVLAPSVATSRQNSHLFAR